jgi:hypothetical protein
MTGGNPWAPATKEKKTGSLLIQTGVLLNSIRPYYVGTDKAIYRHKPGKYENSLIPRFA